MTKGQAEEVLIFLSLKSVKEYNPDYPIGAHQFGDNLKSLLGVEYNPTDSTKVLEIKARAAIANG